MIIIMAKLGPDNNDNKKYSYDDNCNNNDNEIDKGCCR